VLALRAEDGVKVVKVRDVDEHVLLVTDQVFRAAKQVFLLPGHVLPERVYVARCVLDELLTGDRSTRCNRLNVVSQCFTAFGDLAMFGPDALKAFRELWSPVPQKEAAGVRVRNLLEVEVTKVCSDGTSLPCMVSATPLKRPDGTVIGVIEVLTDVTERKRAEAAVLERQRVVQNQNQALVELARSEALYQGDLQAALQAITEAAAQAVETQRASVWFYTEGGDGIHCADLYELDAQRHSEGVVLEAASYPSYFEALKRGVIIAAHDAHTDPSTSEFSESYLTPLGINSMLDVPIQAGGRIVGVVCHEHVGPAREWTLEEQSFVTAIAGLVSTALEAHERVQAEAERERFATQLGTAADIATQVSTILGPDELLNAVIPLLKERFDLYYAHYYRLDEATGELILSAGYGEPGQQMLEQGHKIPLDQEVSLVARAARGKEPVVVHDVTADPDFLANPLLPDTKTEVAVPVIAAGRVLGVFDVQHDQANYFAQGDLNVLTTLAGQVAIALQNANLFEQTQARLRASQALAGAQTEGAVLDAMIRAADLYPQTRVTIYLIDHTADELTMVAAREEAFDSGIVSSVPIGMRLPISQFPLGEHLSPNETFVSANMMEDERADPNIKGLISKMGYASSALLPITAGNEWLGLLALSAKSEGYFDERKLHLYQALAEQGAVALRIARLYEEIQTHAERLHQANVRQSEFLSSMSHELRTPLNSIIGYTEIMLMGIDGELDPETQQDVQAIYDNGQHLLRILNDILDLAKIEAGRLTLNFEEVFVDALIDAARSSATGLLTSKPEVELIIDVPEDLPPIQGDNVRLSQILNNLVSNAVKFTDEGHVRLKAFRDDGYICIEVEDSGIGIAQEDLERIFGKFQQADSAGARRAKGTGLGLPITRQLAELHGGTILVQSQLGQGSTFTLRLPVRRDS